MQRPLSGCAASLSLASREGDDSFAAQRPLLAVAVADLGQACSEAPSLLTIREDISRC